VKTATRLRQATESVVELCVNSPEFRETGTGIVLSRSPFRLLVPAHLILAVEDGSAQDITIDETALRHVTPLSSPLLEQHELAILQIDQPAPPHLRPVRLARSSWVDAYPGQCGVLITPRLLSNHCRSGPIQTVHSDGKATIAVVDVPVAAGDSGSAVFIEGVLAGVVQGRQATEEGSKAIAVLFSEKLGMELRQLAGFQWPSLPKLVKVVLVAWMGLCVVSMPLPNEPISSVNSTPLESGNRNFSVGAMPHAIEFVDGRCFIAQMDTGTLQEFDSQIGLQEAITSSIDQPCDMAAGDEGALFCVNEAGLVVEIDALTGTLLGTTNLQDCGLIADDVVMGIEALQDGFIALFYRNDKPYLLLPEGGYSTIPLVAPATGELSGLQELDGRFFTLAWQNLMVCEIVQLDSVAHLVYSIDITDYVQPELFASGGLRNFHIRESSLYLSSVYYGQLQPDTATLHIVELDAEL
jgi:hypothetical protein